MPFSRPVVISPRLPVTKKWYRQLASTQATALALLEEETPPFWVLAYAQSAGRGRLGRSWHSIEGNFMGSRAMLASSEHPALSLGVGWALHQALGGIAPQRRDSLRMKWPNDILCNGRKLAGILVEKHRKAGEMPLIIGIGVNLWHHPDAATSLYKQQGQTEGDAQTDKEQATQQRCFALADAVDIQLDMLREIHEHAGIAAVIEAWNQHAYGIGEPGVLHSAAGRCAGTFLGVDGQGAALLLREGKIHSFYEGSLHFQQASGKEHVSLH